MAYEIKALSCNPTQLKGLSEKLIVSHYENNYGGAVKRLNAITAQLESLDFSDSIITRTHLTRCPESFAPAPP